MFALLFTICINTTTITKCETEKLMFFEPNISIMACILNAQAVIAAQQIPEHAYVKKFRCISNPHKVKET